MPPLIPSPGRRPSRTLLVCEPAPFWTPELQRRMRAGELHVRGCRLVRELAGEECEAVVIVWDGDDPAVPAMIRQLRSGGSSTPVIVILPARLFAVEWALLDLGATIVLEDTCGGERLAAVVRHATRRPQVTYAVEAPSAAVSALT